MDKIKFKVTYFFPRKATEDAESNSDSGVKMCS